jgi:4-hydroxy-tetrahydrodipicolinate synthase
MTTKLPTDWLTGCATALVTPFAKDGAVDDATMRALVRRQLDGGVRLLVPCGTTGEGATLSADEQRRVIGLTVEAARGRGRVIAGVGTNDTAEVVRRAKAAVEIGADAVLVVSPYYNKPTQAGLIAHFRAVAAAVPRTPVVLYNVPGRTASNVSAQTTLQLAREVTNVVATKEASGNLSQIMAILRDRPDGFRVLSGDDAVTIPLIALGADGVISVAANEMPDLMSRMTELALDGRVDDAREIHYRLLALMEANFLESNPGPVKAVMAMMGLLEETLRLPLVPVQESTRATLRAVLQEIDVLPSAAHAAS